MADLSFDDLIPAKAPKSGETLSFEDLVPAKSPFAGERETGALNAAARGVVDGIPVAGPYLLSGLDRADAALRAYQGGGGYEDELAKARQYGDTVKAAHPYAATAGEIVGGVAGTAPLIAAAPAAFGAGAAGLGARVAASAVSGGVLGGADSAVRSDGDLDAIRKGAMIGSGLGLAAPVVGAAVGAGVRKAGEALADRAMSSAGYGSAAAGKLGEDLAASGGAGAVRVRLGELGPDAMLLDTSPSFTGRAQGLAIDPATRQRIVDPIEARAAGSNARIRTDVDTALGPAVEPDAFRTARQGAYDRAVPPLYREAVAQPVAVDTSGVLALVDGLRSQEKGQAATALNRAWQLLHHEADVPGVGRASVPDRRPEALHNAKEALDAEIARVRAQTGSAANSAVERLGQVRRALNEAIERDVPGYADANRTAQAYFAAGDAFERGQGLLGAGREAVRPGQLAQDTEGMSMLERFAQQLGLRAEVDRHLGTQLNDRVALRRDLMGEGDYNRARMATVFGEEPTQRLAGAVDREAAFDRAHQDIVRGSQTAQRAAAARDIAPREVSAGAPDVLPGVAAAIGGADAGASALLSKLGLGGVRLAASAAGRERDLARNRQIADALVQRPGQTMTELLDALDRRSIAGRMIEAMGSRARLGAQAATISQADRLRPYLPAAPSPFGR